MILIPCYHPKLAYRYANSLNRPVISTFDNLNRVTQKVDNRYLFVYNPISDEAQAIIDNSLYESTLIPCGRCVGCRLDYSREWANRLALDAQLSDNNWFITLTYDDEHLAPNTVNYNGLLIPQLDRSAPSAFIKRLRSYMAYNYPGLADNLHFYLCGEYGEQFARPHYHIILLDCPIPDLKFFGRTKTGYPTYISDIITRLWRNGHVTINEYSWHTGAYVARYMLKKQKGEEARAMKEAGFVTEFVLMSRNPAIAYNYYQQFRDKIYSTDSVVVYKDGKGVSVRPPLYFDRLLQRDDPMLYACIIGQRKKQQRSSLLTRCHDMYANNSIGFQEQRNVDEQEKLNSLSALRRKFESDMQIL